LQNLHSGSAHKNEKEQPFETRIPLKRKRQERNCENFKEVILEILDNPVPVRCRALYEIEKFCQVLIKNILLSAKGYPMEALLTRGGNEITDTPYRTKIIIIIMTNGL
jgi:hypothetical protein